MEHTTEANTMIKYIFDILLSNNLNQLFTVTVYQTKQSEKRHIFYDYVLYSQKNKQ